MTLRGVLVALLVSVAAALHVQAPLFKMAGVREGAMAPHTTVIVPKSHEWHTMPSAPKFRFSSATLDAQQPRVASKLVAGAVAPRVTVVPSHDDLSEYEKQLRQFSL